MKKGTALLIFIFLLIFSSCKKYTATCTKYDKDNEVIYSKTVEHKNLDYVRGYIYGFQKQVEEEGLISKCTKIYKY